MLNTMNYNKKNVCMTKVDIGFVVKPMLMLYIDIGSLEEPMLIYYINIDFSRKPMSTLMMHIGMCCTSLYITTVIHR